MRILELRNIEKKFTERSVFKDFNLTINKGEMVALVGASGCGKTTLLNIIGTLDYEYKGEVFINGKKVGKDLVSTMLIRRKNLAYLFQNFALIDSQTVEENLKIVSSNHKKILKSLSIVGLEDKLKSKIFTLSGGEQQRVAMARILLKECDIILADEPTGSLDYKNTENIFNILLKLKEQGKTIIVVTHDRTLLPYFDKVVELGG